ncbi:hypothetical protein [Sphingobacterium thalpophilum]|uniref:hypothetical protein n=1 Tax=Sphingobacterium thalpophilum TaxID=259 RepID=UPI003D99E1A1
MRIFIYCLVFYFVSAQTVKAQNNNNIDITANKIVREAARSIFKNEVIDSITIELKNDSPIFIHIYKNHSSDNKDRYEGYDLNFLGDEYILKKRYPSVLTFVKEYKLIVAKTTGETGKDYVLIHVLKSGISYSDGSGPLPSYAFVHNGKLRERLQRAYDISSLSSYNSVVIVQGIVERDRTLGDIELIDGKSGVFYDFVKSELKKSAKAGIWFPMTVGGTPFRGLIDIFVCVDSNGIISVDATGRGRRLQVTDTNKSAKIYF